MRKLTVSTFSVCAAASLTLAGCGSDDATTAEEPTPTAVASAAASSTSESTPDQSSSAVQTSENGSNTEDDPDAIGGTQDVAGEGFTAKVQVLNEPTIHPDPIPTLAFPVVIDVQSGEMHAGPKYWKVRTLSGRTLQGGVVASISTSIGSDTIDGHAEGLVTFPDRIGNELTDDVSIAEIALYPGTMSKDPIARWKLPEPVAVPDIPAPQGQ